MAFGMQKWGMVFANRSILTDDGKAAVFSRVFVVLYLRPRNK